ncbi:DUF6538 domain-containing protein [Sphingomonas sp. 28-63-12]|uniref:DUF6538 domain-containing protein n=1 Tax=Sphingomonas sp. 28-63-12 TaxID=1970434 RepID=UPI000BC8E809|nr:MAG: hypothetical protein B7Y47_12515 [Sphingomonas sp. 28-63-12]
MCTYLAKRGATYYFRRPVPEELQPYAQNRREWMISLRCKDRETAKRKIPEHTIATDALIAEARGALQRDSDRSQATLTNTAADAQVKPLAASPGQAEQADYEAAEAKAAADRWEARAPERSTLRHRLATRRSNELHLSEQAMRDILRERDARYAALVAERQSEGQANLARDAARRTEPVPLLVIFDAYAKEQGLKPTTTYEWRRNINALVDFLGHDDATRIGVDDLDRWREKLLGEITKRGSLRSPTTVKDKYFAALRATLNWAVEKRKLTDNVAKLIVIRVPKKVKLRERDFTSLEANAILAASLVPSKSAISDHLALARRWVPWLCAYTGARVNEITQLRGEDIAQIDGFWTMRVTPEAGTQKTNEARIVPLHAHLIEQGFLAVAEAAGASPIFYDPRLVRTPGLANRHPKKVGERLAKWVRDDVGITDIAIMPNHAWRHTFKTLAIEAEIPERVADAIQGHKPRSVGQTYGSVSLKAQAAAVAKLPRHAIPGWP